MLPNWLYGKSKSKLASILGGGGGAPEDYNQVKAQVAQNKEDILLLSDALDDKAALTQISNPNIFHNPWFAVNQRGVTSATQNADYIADRWMVYFGGNNATITRDSNGNIVMDNSLGTRNITIYQKRTQTYLNSLVGQKLTASMMLSDGTIYSGTITYTGTGNPVYFENDYVKAHAPVLTANQIITYSVKPGASVTIKAFKLEVGEVSTLHLDPRPEYAVELAKCQRYFQRMALTVPTDSLCIATYRNSAVLRTIIPLAVPMRANPTVTVNGTVSDYTNSGLAMTRTGTPATNGGDFTINFNIQKSGVTWSDGVSKLITPDDASFYIDFDAEL